LACTAAIQEATTALKAAVNSPNCCGNIQTQFKLCSPLSNTNSEDVASLFEYMAGNFAGIIQYNGFYSLDLNDLCNVMTNTALGDPLARYAAVNDLLLNLYGASCTDSTYASWIDYLSETSWDSPSAQDGCKQQNITNTLYKIVLNEFLFRVFQIANGFIRLALNSAITNPLTRLSNHSATNSPSILL
jgi:hypothetical protein